MDRRWSRLFAGLLIGLALGLALLEGVPNVKDSSARALLPHEDSTHSETEHLSDSAPEHSSRLAVGSTAPGFILQDLDGNNVSLEDFRGKDVLLNFWATWCGPCRIEMPLFERTYNEHRDHGLIVVGINFDEPEQTVINFREEFGLTFPILLDPGADVQRLYQILGYPSSIWIDREGNIRKIHIGILLESQLEAYLEEVGIGT
jgi:peroxiredoxin